MAFPPDFLDELRVRVPLGDLVGKQVKLIRRGRELTGLCPFHKEKSPSFTVSEDKGFYHCFGCGEHGDVISFVMKTQNLPFMEAIERLAGEAGLEMPRQSPEEKERHQRRASLYEVVEAAADWFQQELRGRDGQVARDYLKGRGLSEDTIATFRLGFAPNRRGALATALTAKGIAPQQMIEAGLMKAGEEGKPPRDYFFDRVIFPITDAQGRVIAFGGRALDAGAPAKYLNSPENPLFHKGQALYNLARARTAAHESGEVVVVEGYMDVIALAEAGFAAAVAPLGTAVTDHQLRLLWRLTAEPIVCLDGDSAGRRAALRTGELALPLLAPGKSLSFALLPEAEDPDSLVKTQGLTAFRKVLENRRALSDVLWGALQGRPARTPEDRAAIVQEAGRLVDSIAESAVKAAYKEDFNRRIHAAFGFAPWGRVNSQDSGARPRPNAPWARSGNRGRWGKGPDGRFGFQIPPRPIAASHDPERLKRRREQLLIAALVNHPGLVEELIEDLAAFRCHSSDLEGLKTALVDLAANGADLDIQAVKCHLRTHGMDRVLDEVLTETVYQHGAFARPESDGAAAQVGLRHLLDVERVERDGGGTFTAALPDTE